MANIPPTRKAGPLGRARLSTVLMRRPGLVEPSLLQNANILATGRRTARGQPDVALDYTAVPSGVQAEMEKLVLAHNSLLATLRARGLMELQQ